MNEFEDGIVSGGTDGEQDGAPQTANRNAYNNTGRAARLGRKASPSRTTEGNKKTNEAFFAGFAYSWAPIFPPAVAMPSRAVFLTRYIAESAARSRSCAVVPSPGNDATP